MRHARLALGLSLACLPALAGCLFVRHSESVIRSHEARRQVAFENDLARRVFEDQALNETARSTSGTGGVVAIPFLLWWSNTKVKAPDAWYNDSIKQCDKDADKTISEAEALAFNPDFGRETDSFAAVQVEPDRPVKRAGHEERAAPAKKPVVGDPEAD